MKNNNRFNLKLNTGTGMVMGILVSAAIALLVGFITGDSSVWSWAIPVGLACGLAIGAGAANNNGSTTKKDVS
jgi:hypothetical protein